MVFSGGCLVTRVEGTCCCCLIVAGRGGAISRVCSASWLHSYISSSIQLGTTGVVIGVVAGVVIGVVTADSLARLACATTPQHNSTIKFHKTPQFIQLSDFIKGINLDPFFDPYQGDRSRSYFQSFQFSKFSLYTI